MSWRALCRWVGFALALVLLAGACFVSPFSSLMLGLSAAGLFCGLTLLCKPAEGGCSNGGILVLTGVIWCLALMAFYVLNPSHEWRSGGALPIRHLSYMPASADPAATMRALKISLLLLAGAVLGRSLSWRQVSWVGAFLVAGSASMAVVAIGQRLSLRTFPVFELTGAFRYENHYAAFANLTLPLALFWGLRARTRALQAGSASSPVLLYGWAACLIGTAILVSGSRAGIAMMCGSLCLSVLWRHHLEKRYPFLFHPIPRGFKWAGFVLVLAALAYGGSRVYTSGAVSVKGLRQELSFRGAVIGDTLDLWRDKTLWGAGPGTFASVFPYYQSLPLETFSLTHAHCEMVEWLAEYGLLGCTALLIGLFMLFNPLKTPCGESVQQVPKWREVEGVALALALLTLGLHATVDFPFRHPLIALMAACYLGMLSARNRDSGDTRHD